MGDIAQASITPQQIFLPSAGAQVSLTVKASTAMAFKVKVNKPQVYTGEQNKAAADDRLVVEVIKMGGDNVGTDPRVLFAKPSAVKQTLRVSMDGSGTGGISSTPGSSDESGDDKKTTSGLCTTLLKEVAPASKKAAHNKVTVVGVGQVGMACAYSILQQGLASEMSLIDMEPKKLEGERLDLAHGMAFVRPCRIKADTEYAISAGSRVCIITAGVRQVEGESRLSLVQRNVNVLRAIVPKLVEYSPGTTLLVVSNPVDILTFVAWRLSGLPAWRVLGSGTNLDSGRFRVILANKMQIAPSSVHAWIIGEHGDSSVPVWSSANVAGVQIRTPDNESAADWNKIHKDVVNSAYHIIKLKGYTSWAIGLSVAAIIRSLLRDSRNVYALTTNARGYHGIEQDVFLSLPDFMTPTEIRDNTKMYRSYFIPQQNAMNDFSENTGSLMPMMMSLANQQPTDFNYGAMQPYGEVTTGHSNNTNVSAAASIGGGGQLDLVQHHHQGHQQHHNGQMQLSLPAPPVPAQQAHMAAQMMGGSHARQSSPSSSASAAGHTAGKVSLFVMKLWKIVNNDTYGASIGWDQEGSSFHIHEPYQFCKDVLPLYFKHNNLNSLIRQLNMYGFRKITPLDRCGLARADSDHAHLQFAHSCFVRNRSDLLTCIHRKGKVGGGGSVTSSHRHHHHGRHHSSHSRNSSVNFDTATTRASTMSTSGSTNTRTPAYMSGMAGGMAATGGAAEFGGGVQGGNGTGNGGMQNTASGQFTVGSEQMAAEGLDVGAVTMTMLGGGMQHRNMRDAHGAQSPPMGNSPASLTLEHVRLLKQVASQVRRIGEHQAASDARIAALIKENQSLWSEITRQRAEYNKRQDVVHKLIQFLMRVLHPARAAGTVPALLAIQHESQNVISGNDEHNGPIIDETDPDINACYNNQTAAADRLVSWQKKRSRQDLLITDVTDEPEHKVPRHQNQSHNNQQTYNINTNSVGNVQCSATSVGNGSIDTSSVDAYSTDGRGSNLGSPTQSGAGSISSTNSNSCGSSSAMSNVSTCNESGTAGTESTNDGNSSANGDCNSGDLESGNGVNGGGSGNGQGGSTCAMLYGWADSMTNMESSPSMDLLCHSTSDDKQELRQLLAGIDEAGTR